MPTVVQVLKAAKQFLEAHQWEQGKLVTDKDGNELNEPYRSPAGACALGALCIANIKLRPAASVYMRAKDLLEAAMGGDIVYFNNAHGRKKTTILSRFDRAIKVARQ